jgi:glycosyltransferase involved in cell wall biosynthesis
MKVSVLIPTYNRAYIVREALESALRQTYANFEIVVVDDGSNDNTRELVAGFANEKIRYFRHAQNRGYSAACNTAIRNATGDVLGFLDSDDLWHPDYLHRHVSFLLRHSGVGAVFSDLEILNGPTTIPSLIRKMKVFPLLLEVNGNAPEIVITSRQMYLCLLQEIPIKPTALLVRRELYDRAGLFNESWPSGTDWDLFLRFSQLTQFGYIDAPLAVQKWSSDATHRKYWEQDKTFLIKIFLAEKRKLYNDPEALLAIRHGLAVQYSQLAFHNLYAGKHKESIAVYLKGFYETRDLGLLLRALSALVPIGWRDSIKQMLGRGTTQ